MFHVVASHHVAELQYDDCSRPDNVEVLFIENERLLPDAVGGAWDVQRRGWRDLREDVGGCISR